MTNLPADVLQKNALAFTTEDGGMAVFANRGGALQVELVDAEGSLTARPLIIKAQVVPALVQVLTAWQETKLTAP